MLKENLKEVQELREDIKFLKERIKEEKEEGNKFNNLNFLESELIRKQKELLSLI